MPSDLPPIDHTPKEYYTLDGINPARTDVIGRHYNQAFKAAGAAAAFNIVAVHALHGVPVHDPKMLLTSIAIAMLGFGAARLSDGAIRESAQKKFEDAASVYDFVVAPKEESIAAPMPKLEEQTRFVRKQSYMTIAYALLTAYVAQKTFSSADDLKTAENGVHISTALMPVLTQQITRILTASQILSRTRGYMPRPRG